MAPPIIKGVVPVALAQRYGGYARPIFSFVTIQPAQTLIIAANMDRVALTLANLGAVDVTVLHDARVTASRGFPLRSLGGTLSVDIFEDAILPAWEWYGFSTGAAVEISVMEVVVDVRIPA